MQDLLQSKIVKYGLSIGNWYFLRALAHEDGLTHAELAAITETRAPSALSAILALERAGFVTRVQNQDDKRKVNVFLTPGGRRLNGRLKMVAEEVAAVASRDFSAQEKALFLQLLERIRTNVFDELGAMKALLDDEEVSA